MQELHARGLANPDHTTLLLNCYTKTGDKARLDNFIKTETSRSGDKGESQELPFDLDTAIRVCRQAGFYEHAVYLAKKYQRHEDYLRIQLEDAKDYEDALGYIRQLGPKMVSRPVSLGFEDRRLLIMGTFPAGISFRRNKTYSGMVEPCYNKSRNQRPTS